jgi:hypothetical protein
VSTLTRLWGLRQDFAAAASARHPRPASGDADGGGPGGGGSGGDKPAWMVKDGGAPVGGKEVRTQAFAVNSDAATSAPPDQDPTPPRRIAKVANVSDVVNAR